MGPSLGDRSQVPAAGSDGGGVVVSTIHEPCSAARMTAKEPVRTFWLTHSSLLLEALT